MNAGARIRDRQAIAEYLRADPALHIYELGDLDEMFWRFTRWYATASGGRIEGLALLYTGFEVPTLIALDRRDNGAHLADLVAAVAASLGAPFYAHLSSGAAASLDGWSRPWSARMVKMALPSRERLPTQSDPDVVVLGGEDLLAVEELLALAHPDHWFDQRLLATGYYLGVRRDGALVAMAGVHVLSASYRVAALGNIATHPAHRGQGLARRTTGELCRRLSASCDEIGLNVAESNEAALRCYRALGFEVCADYLEARFERD